MQYVSTNASDAMKSYNELQKRKLVSDQFSKGNSDISTAKKARFATTSLEDERALIKTKSGKLPPVTT